MELFYIQQLLISRFTYLGGLIARYPLHFLILPIAITAMLVSGFCKMEIITDHNWFSTVSITKAADNKELVKRLFPLNSSTFVDTSRITEISNMTIVQIVAKDKDTILRQNLFQEILKLDNFVKNMVVEVNGTAHNYKSLCGKKGGKCFEYDLNEIYSNLQGIRHGKYKLSFPADVYKTSLAITYKDNSFLGGVRINKNGYVRDVMALRLFYIFDFSDPSKSSAIKKWEIEINKYLTSESFEYIDVTFINDAVTIEKFNNGLLTLVCLVLLIVLVFSFVSCMTNNWVRSKPWLGISACISAGLAAASGFGLSFHLGIEYHNLSLLVIYATLATEIDDAFILIATWRTTDTNLPVEERMKRTFSQTSVSIAISSLTTISSYCVGMITPLPLVRILCSIGALCSLFAFLYQITFFGACMALSGRREERNMHSVTLCVMPVKRKTEDRTLKYETDSGDFIMLQFQEKIGKLLRYPAAKVSILIIFLANVGVAVWGFTFVEYGTDVTDVYKNDSPLNKFLDINNRYFSRYTYPVHVIIDKTYNYADKDVQDKIEATLQNFESLPNIADSSLRLSWLKYYKIFANMPTAKILLSGYNMSKKQDFIDGLRHIFLKFPLSKQFEYDIVFNEDYTDIISTRFILLSANSTSAETSVKAIRDIYDVSMKSPIRVRPFSLTFYLVEHALVIKTITIQLICTAAALNLLIFFTLNPNIKSAFCVAIIVACVICEVIGYLALWDVKMDFSSMTTLFMGTAFSINFCTHVSFSYTMGKNKTAEGKTNKAIYETGYPIVQGVLSSILSLLVLLFEPRYVLTNMYKGALLIALLTSFHSIFVIPVLLSIFGSHSKIPEDKKFVEFTKLTEK